MITVKFDIDKWCSYRKVKITKDDSWKNWFCPICNKPFKKGDDTFFL
jgi:hypothetical protein